MEQFNRITCSTRVLIAARGHVGFYEKIKESLELASDTSAPIYVEDWHTSIRSGRESIECCGLVIASEALVNDYDTEGIALMFKKLIPNLVGRESVLSQETVLFIHESELVLVETLCESFGLELSDMLQVDDGKPFCYFSLTRDFSASRYRRSLTTRDFKGQPIIAPKEPGPDNSLMTFKTSWLAVIVEPDKETAEDLRSFLVNKALRQNLTLEILLRHNVEEAVRGISARIPFAVSINPMIPLAEHGLMDAWGGLEILTTAKEFDVPAIIRSGLDPRQIERALRRRRIAAKPKKVVSVNLANAWADEMLACLISTTKH